MSWVQRAGLWGDKAIDTIQEYTGYPGACVKDEGQPVHIPPSIVYPTFGSGWWKCQQNKFSWGPTASGPGVHPNGSEDYSDH